MSWLADPLYALDTEATGTDPETARVLTCCLGYSPAPGVFNPTGWEIAPGVPIPPEATKVHGITDAQAALGEAPAVALAQIRAALCRVAECGRPIVLHNAPYDLTLLDREMARHLGEGLPGGLLVLDTLVLFRRFDSTTGSRTLSGLAGSRGIRFPAHDAEADALATLRLLHILATTNDLLPEVAPSRLHELQAGWYRHQQEGIHAARLGRGDLSGALDEWWPVRPSREEVAA